MCRVPASTPLPESGPSPQDNSPNTPPEATDQEPPLSPTDMAAIFDSMPLLEDDPPSPTMQAPFAHVEKPSPYKGCIIPMEDGSGHFDSTRRSRPSRLSMDDLRFSDSVVDELDHLDITVLAWMTLILPALPQMFHLQTPPGVLLHIHG